MTPYAIYQEGGAWSSGGGGSGYPDLRINYHTGIVLAAHQNYGGVRFQRDYNDATELMSVGNGDNHVRVAENLYVAGDIVANGGGGGVTITSSDIRSDGTSTWTGNPGASVGKIQLHSNRWYIVANSNSNRLLQLRQDGTDKSWFANDGQLYHGSSNTTDKYWRQGNDGAGSGLDADTCDGQHLGTAANPTFNNIYSSAWFRNNDSAEGLYNTANTTHWYAASTAYWALDGNGSNGGIQFRDNHGSTVRGYVYFNSSNNVGILNNGGSWIIQCNSAKSTLFHGHVYPSGSIDLGSSSSRWNNIYVNDLQLSNESKKDEGGNDVDGTWGDWTLQEGEENIFMINNLSLIHI